MEVILTDGCLSLTGSLGRGFGYHIQRRKNRFYGKRNTKGNVPREGHMRFIFACADIAKLGLHIQDVKVGAEELESALIEAGKYQAAQRVKQNADAETKLVYDARDIMNLKITFGL